MLFGYGYEVVFNVDLVRVDDVVLECVFDLWLVDLI